MNNKTGLKQSGNISKVLLVLIIAGLSFGTYVINKKGSINQLTSFLSNTVAQPKSDFKGYGIQLVATAQLDRAKNIMNDFARDGYSAYVLSSKHQGRTYYKVRLGPYHHKPEAIAIKDKVIRRYPNNPYVKSSLVIYKPN